MTISIGVYCSKIDDESADKVVSYADAALYEAKILAEIRCVTIIIKTEIYVM